MNLKREFIPKTIILDVLRLTRCTYCPAAKLIAVGELFDFKVSAMRVALTRLLACGRIETDGNSGYRLSSQSDLLSDYIEQWRIGDLRRRDWQKDDWLMVLLPSNPDRTVRTSSQTTLEFFGFRKAQAKVWVRPNNLVPSLNELRTLYQGYGLESEALVFQAAEIPYPQQFIWESTLWNTENLEFNYEKQLAKLARSSQRIADFKLNDALRESFIIGGETIKLLVKDPLLPDEMFCTTRREELRLAMCDYDASGHKIWKQFMGDTALTNVPQC